MKLKYRILWFEDDDEVVEDQIGPSLKTFLVELGFQLEIVHRLNGEKLEELLRDRNYDLIVTDLNLGEYETGEVLIDQVRQGNILTEVLLYSANTTELNNIIANKGWVERASFCVGLGNLNEKLVEIIGLTIRKNQDVNNTRGLVIAETIDLEKKIEKILLHYFDAAEEKVLNESKISLLKNIHVKKLEKHEADIASLKSVDFTKVKTLIENDILTASNSFDAIQSILKDKLKRTNALLNSGKIEPARKEVIESMKSDLETVKNELNNFRDEILKIRNTLAHVKEEIGEDGVPFLESLNADGTILKFDNIKYVEIRKNLRKHNDNLDRVLKHIEDL